MAILLYCGFLLYRHKHAKAKGTATNTSSTGMGNSASLSSLPYLIENEIEPSTRQGSYGWSIHSGKRKSDGMAVCVFKASKPRLIQTPLSQHFSGNNFPVAVGKDRVDPNCQFFPALHHFAKSKTLVHPYLLKVYATLDTDAPADTTAPSSGNINAAPYATIGTAGDLVIVTEQGTPLRKWLDEQHDQKPEKLAWGLVCLVKALDFLHTHAKMSHACLSLDSVFVTPAGDFKLANFSLLLHSGASLSRDEQDYFRKYESVVCPLAYRSQERVNSEYDFIFNSLPPHAIDSFSLGVFVEDVYDGSVPDKLVKAVARLKAFSATQRPRLAPLLKCPVLDVPHCKSMEFLEEIAVKPTEEKIAFYQSVPDQLARKIITQEAAKYKLLPSMMLSLKSIIGNPQAISQDVTRREVLAIIPPLFSIGDMLDDASFQAQISPFIAALFQLNDRGIRAALLNRLPALTGRLDKQSINSCVFEPMCTGFTDSSAALREMTLKSTLPLISNLNSVNIEKLGRYLIRLQSDSEDSIRTNTVIFISKIAPSLSENTRSKLILPAFTRAMKDPFHPCRLAALKSILHCKAYFEPNVIAEQVLPCVVPHLIDATTQVRKEAFTVLDQFTATLRIESDRMEQSREVEEVPGVPAQVTTSVTSVPSSASSSYISGLTSWMTSHAKAPPTGNIEPSGSVHGGQPSPLNSSQVALPSPLSDIQPPSDGLDSESLHLIPSNSMNAAGIVIESDGWMDDEDILREADDSIESVVNGRGPASKPNTSIDLAKKPTEDDLFASVSLKQADVDDFFTSSMVGARKIGSMGGTNMGSRPMPSSSTSLSIPNKKKQSLADRKAEFSQRKAGREKNKQPTVVGVKKLSDANVNDGWDDF